jgi:hypothetical protein
LRVRGRTTASIRRRSSCEEKRPPNRLMGRFSSLKSEPYSPGWSQRPVGHVRCSWRRRNQRWRLSRMRTGSSALGSGGPFEPDFRSCCFAHRERRARWAGRQSRSASGNRPASAVGSGSSQGSRIPLLHSFAMAALMLGGFARISWDSHCIEKRVERCRTHGNSVSAVEAKMKLPADTIIARRKRGRRNR